MFTSLEVVYTFASSDLSRKWWYKVVKIEFWKFSYQYMIIWFLAWFSPPVRYGHDSPVDNHCTFQSQIVYSTHIQTAEIVQKSLVVFLHKVIVKSLNRNEKELYCISRPFLRLIKPGFFHVARRDLSVKESKGQRAAVTIFPSFLRVFLKFRVRLFHCCVLFSITYTLTPFQPTLFMRLWSTIF